MAGRRLIEFSYQYGLLAVRYQLVFLKPLNQKMSHTKKRMRMMTVTA